MKGLLGDDTSIKPLIGFLLISISFIAVVTPKKTLIAVAIVSNIFLASYDIELTKTYLANHTIALSILMVVTFYLIFYLLQIRQIHKLQKKTFDVAYSAHPGEIALTRNLKYVRKILISQGIEVVKKDGGLKARMEKGAFGNPSVITYWDDKGRVIKTFFVGNRGAIGTHGITNFYKFDDKGRLIESYQEMHPTNKKPKYYSGSKYIYINNKPDNEYTKIYTGFDGKKETLTYEERKRRSTQERPRVLGFGP